jgi:hypothetical protein
MTTSRFPWLVGAIFLLALLVRAVYFLGAETPSPIVGDIHAYWSYAWNLVNHGVFSIAPPGPAVPVPDAFRAPGYPWFLALCLRLTESPEQALRLAQWGQILIGSLLAPVSIVLARRWLAPPLALLAGLLVALWPHLVVFSSTMLSETLYALLLLLALLAFAETGSRRRAAWAVLAGLAAGAAWLVNPVFLFLPLLLALHLWRNQGERRLAAVYLLAFALVVGAWSLRNAVAGAGSGGARAGIAFVEGTWPMCFDAYNNRDRSEIAAAIVNQIEEEKQLLATQPRAGLAAIGERMRAEPATYLRWYAFEKPWLLWSWNVQIGWGDIYFLQTYRSPFERNAGLRAIRAVFHALNPVFFGVALLTALGVGFAALRRRPTAAPALFALAASFLYVTAVHVLLAAEPRYAVPYRPLEILLAVSGCALAAEAWRRRRKA